MRVVIEKRIFNGIGEWEKLGGTKVDDTMREIGDDGFERVREGFVVRRGNR
jgi:hypothetical protein